MGSSYCTKQVWPVPVNGQFNKEFEEKVPDADACVYLVLVLCLTCVCLKSMSDCLVAFLCPTHSYYNRKDTEIVSLIIYMQSNRDK